MQQAAEAVAERTPPRAPGTASQPAQPAKEVTPAKGEAGGKMAAAGEGDAPRRKSSAYKGVTLFKPTMKWRAQISAGGKTTSLGDHDTEAEAAVAFDRAAINKGGRDAKTNFPMANYEAEIDDLQAMAQGELVAMLRSWARKSGAQTSHYRGVSLLKQTRKWHAQINVGGRQVHLGFFPSEPLAARAYDRAAINKSARDASRLVLNFDVADYGAELDGLRRIAQQPLVEALASETRRPPALELLASGDLAACKAQFGPGFDASPHPAGVCSVADLRARAERAQPKPTSANPLYANFGKRRQDGDGPLLPLVTRPEGFPAPPPPVAQPPRRPGRPRALFRRRRRRQQADSSDDTDSEASEDEAAASAPEEGSAPAAPSRRSARAAARTVKHYSEAGSSDDEGEPPGAEAAASSSDEAGPADGGAATAPHTPQQPGPSASWAAASPPMRRRARPDKKKGRREEPPAPVAPAEQPTWELLAHAVAAAHGGQPAAAPPPAPPASTAMSPAGTSAALAPAPEELPRRHSAATAGSRATADAPDSRQPPRAPPADQTSQVQASARPAAATAAADAAPAARSATPGLAAPEGTPSVAQAPAAAAAPTGRASVEQIPVQRGGSLGEKGSVVLQPPRDAPSTLAGFGGGNGGDKLSDAGVVALQLPPPAAAAQEIASPEAASKRSVPRKGAKRREPEAAEPPTPVTEGKPLTKRQRALADKRAGQAGVRAATPLPAAADPSPKSSQAANAQPSPRASVARQQEDAASQSSPQAGMDEQTPAPVKPLTSSSDGSHGPLGELATGDGRDSPLRRDGPNRRKRKQPARAAI